MPPARGARSQAASAMTCALAPCVLGSALVEAHHMRAHLRRIVKAWPLLEPLLELLLERIWPTLTRRWPLRTRPHIWHIWRGLPGAPDLANFACGRLKRQRLRRVGRLWRALHRFAVRHACHLKLP